MFQVSQDSNLLLQTYAMAKGFSSPQQRCYTWTQPDPQVKPELEITLQEKITGDSKAHLYSFPLCNFTPPSPY